MNTTRGLPDATLLAFAEHDEIDDLLPADGGDAEEVLARFAQVGVDVAACAADLQQRASRCLT